MTETDSANTSIQMSPYETQVWQALNSHWEKRDNRRGLPNWANEAAKRTGEALSKTGEKVSRAIPDTVKEKASQAGEAVMGAALRPTAEAILSLLTLVDDWAMELNDPRSVEKLAAKQGVEIDSYRELRQLDLKIPDRLLARNTLFWRSAGALEGGAMGALALVPFAGMPASIGADVLVIQILSVSIASQVAYAHGFDAKDPTERAFIERLMRRSFTGQVAKAKPVNDAARAAEAIAGRQRWSDKLRTDHRIIEQLEKLMQKWYPKGQVVPVGHVAKALPFIGIAIGAGVNQHVLAQVAKDAQRYCQTRFISEKYGLPLPAALRAYGMEEDEEFTIGEDRTF